MTGDQRFIHHVQEMLEDQGYETEIVESDVLEVFADDWRFTVTIVADIVE